MLITSIFSVMSEEQSLCEFLKKRVKENPVPIVFVTIPPDPDSKDLNVCLTVNIVFTGLKK